MSDEARMLLGESGQNGDLPDDAYVFSMHQGYTFSYFKLSEGADPPVCQYVEGEGRPVLAWHSFSDFLRSEIASHGR